MLADGTIAELVMLDGVRAARVLCPLGMVPAPGRYLVAYAEGSDVPLPTALFAVSAFADPRDPGAGGFVTVPPVPALWAPGTYLHMRGPLGHGFSVPALARRIALIASDVLNTPASGSPRRLLSLLDPAFKQGASVTLVCEHAPEDLPLQVEVQPRGALAEVCNWADYVACDSRRDSLPQLKDKLAKRAGLAQVLVGVPMPCAGLAECGVCTVEAGGGQQLACEEGPVFDLDQLMR